MDGRTRVEERLDEKLDIACTRQLKRAVIRRVDIEAQESPEITLSAWVRRAIKRELRRARRHAS